MEIEKVGYTLTRSEKTEMYCNDNGLKKRLLTLALVKTILPETKISSTIFSSFIRQIKPGKSFASYWEVKGRSKCEDSSRKLQQGD
jgi:hypothetical protein